MDTLDNIKRVNAKINRKYAFSLILLLLILLPIEAAMATGSIVRRITNFCAGFTVTPDISASCSVCHTGARTLTDLNATGILARSSANDIQFCPSKSAPVVVVPVDPAPVVTPTPGTGGGMTGTAPVTGSMGRGMGGSRDDDDDDDESDDDDDRASSASSRFSRFLRSLGVTTGSTRSSRGSRSSD